MIPPKPVWSVIVITRNEERRIGSCLESVFSSLRDHLFEVIVVDSASTDHTVEVVHRFPARLIRLEDDLPLSPAAGRHVGFQVARGDLLLFMDGDSVLLPDWVEPALGALRDSRVAGVSGIRQLVLLSGSGVPVRLGSQYSEREVDYDCPEYLGGPALYRRYVLQKVGGFNPFLFALEEAELGGRIRAAGYSLRRLKIPMTEHLVEARHETLTDLFRRVRRGFPYGIGQLVRHGLKNRCLGREHFAHLDRHLGFLLLILVGGGGLLRWMGWGRPDLLMSWLSVSFLGFVFFCFRARSLAKPMYYMVEWAVYGPMAIRGFLMRPKEASEYPFPRPGKGDETSQSTVEYRSSGSSSKVAR